MTVTITPTVTPTLYVDEAPDRDGWHTSETVSWLVLEAGRWQVASGVQLEVGNLATSATVGQGVSNQWAQVTFTTAFSSRPVVLSQVQSELVADQWLKTRQTSVSATGFQVALEGPESMTQTVAVDEVIGWLAMEAGGCQVLLRHQ